MLLIYGQGVRVGIKQFLHPKPAWSLFSITITEEEWVNSSELMEEVAWDKWNPPFSFHASRTVHNIEALYLFVISVLALFFNGTVLVTVYKNKVSG